MVLTAVSSILNRKKLNKVELRIDNAVVTIAAQVKETKEVKEAVQETKELTSVVNAEVVKQVHDSGVEAGKAIAKNGH